MRACPALSVSKQAPACLYLRPRFGYAVRPVREDAAMKAQLMFASLFTMGVLTGFVATVVLLAMYWGGMINAVGLIALTVLFNVAAWLLSPWIQDLILRWFYGAEVVEWWDFQQRWPRLAKDIEASCAKHRVPISKMRIIDDGNPTAYCFGSGPWNSRLVATRGLFHYLDEDEVTAVYFHELGTSSTVTSSS